MRERRRRRDNGERSAQNEQIEVREEPWRLRREQRAEQNEDDDQACLLAQHKGAAARRFKYLIGHSGRCSLRPQRRKAA
jgi:hypothetical protein